MDASRWTSPNVDLERFRHPSRQAGIYPFWFLNGELDPEEMNLQLHEFYTKGMAGIILHGRYGLEMPYLGDKYRQRIAHAIRQGTALGLDVLVYDEMNWPSGTADGQVLRARPDLAQRYIECIVSHVRGPYFTYLTGADSRYMDFERSTPIAAFAVGEDGTVLDLTPNLSFHDVIPWEAPAGNWQILYIVEKRAEYYIDALNPESTAEFLRLGYAPYLPAIGDGVPGKVLGFYTDEPAMHYFLTASDNAVVPWTKDMFRRFMERNGYDLRPRLPDLFMDVSPDSARVRYDFYTTLTDFYSAAYYQQIHEWCQANGLIFTGHLLFEEWLRRLVRVEGDVFKHYAHLDIIGVDHLYPIIGNEDRPEEHVALKLASSAAHQLRSPRLLCESFGGVFMDATLQRLKWIADWEYLLGVTLLNPHGYHYTQEGPRKRDWPPSMFYQTPWWRYYQGFSDYVSRLTDLLSGGEHVSQIGIIWPQNAILATYRPQAHNALADRTEQDLDTLTDLLLRLHHECDYVEEDMLAGAELADGAVHLADEAYRLLILPPVTHIKLGTLEQLEQFVAQGGRVLGMIFLPDVAFGPDGLVDIRARVQALFGVDPTETQQSYQTKAGIDVIRRAHGAGQTAFIQSYALARRIPTPLLQRLGTRLVPESPYWLNESADDTPRYWFVHPELGRTDITADVLAERKQVADCLATVLAELVCPMVVADNPNIWALHRRKDGRDILFFINSTHQAQRAQVAIAGSWQPVLWDPTTGDDRPVAPSLYADERTRFTLELAPVGSTFVLLAPPSAVRIVDTNLMIEQINGRQASGYTTQTDGYLTMRNGEDEWCVSVPGASLPEPVTLSGPWTFQAADENALVMQRWEATAELPAGVAAEDVLAGRADIVWLPMVPGAWSYQLPAEPTRPYPQDVWYRLHLAVEGPVPATLGLTIDGFAGSSWDVYVNGTRATATPQRSAFDAQMKRLEIAPLVRAGTNTILVRFTVTEATDGLLDGVKFTGPFALQQSAEGWRLVPPVSTGSPCPWTEQGYPFYSGLGVYQTRFVLGEDWAGLRLFLEPVLADDAVEVIVNGQIVGTRLWPPYGIEITSAVRAGENELELRVANTPVNLFEGIVRPSGLMGAPRLVACRGFEAKL